MQTTPDVLIRDAMLVSMDPAIGSRRRADVHVREGRIAEIGDLAGVRGGETVDGRGMIVMPGLIESHFHMWSSLGRNFIADDYEYFPAKWATAALYEPDDFYKSVALGLAEALDAGITTVHNWSHNTRSPAHADAELSAHRDIRARARYAYGHRDGLPGEEPLDFADIDRVASTWFGHDDDFGERVHLAVNLRGPDLGSVTAFDQEMAAARARRLPVAIHTVQGGHTEVSAVELERKGYLGPDFLIAHFLAATPDDRAAMARSGTPLSYAVHSELRLGEAGDARAALLATRAAGVTVSFSIDATSIAPVDLFQAMNVAWNLGIPWTDSPTSSLPRLGFGDCLEMATINGARALGIEAETGSLTPGKAADLVLVRAGDLNVAPAVHLESTIVRSVTPANVDSVMVAGRWVKRGGELVGINRSAIVAAATLAADGIRGRAGGRLALEAGGPFASGTISR